MTKTSDFSLRPPVGTVALKTDFDLYRLIMPITVFPEIAARNLTKTIVGRAFTAIYDSDVAAWTMGVNLIFYEKLAFTVSVFYTGTATEASLEHAW